MERVLGVRLFDRIDAVFDDSRLDFVELRRTLPFRTRLFVRAIMDLVDIADDWSQPVTVREVVAGAHQLASNMNVVLLPNYNFDDEIFLLLQGPADQEMMQVETDETDETEETLRIRTLRDDYSNAGPSEDRSIVDEDIRMVLSESTVTIDSAESMYVRVDGRRFQVAPQGTFARMLARADGAEKSKRRSVSGAYATGDAHLFGDATDGSEKQTFSGHAAEFMQWCAADGRLNGVELHSGES